MLSGVTVIPGVYIFVDTVNFLEITFLHIVGEYTNWPLRKHVSVYGVYKYILNRWPRIVCVLFLRRTPGVHRTPRVWISAYMGYIYDMRTPYRRPTHCPHYVYTRYYYILLSPPIQITYVQRSHYHIMWYWNSML